MTCAHDFSFRDIEGRDLPLRRYAGKAVLVVNVASQCGLAPQYAGLQRLWRDRRETGLIILGVPCNDFGGQEPGSEAEIRQFCESRFAADFPMTAKEHVVGADAHPLYRWVATELGDAATPKWNFHK
ncbi:MAG: glutathione peroxidase, partial [Alphaproteobacteria bacterium]|nr:glutathione peroxidase [Alphaproteobacteria bacterium]